MNLHSGKKRFYVYDLKKNLIIASGLMSHGSCNDLVLFTAKFSNDANSGCSSLGKYKVGNAYDGRFGKAFKLYGLEATNSNAYYRFVVLHAYSCVPDVETYPVPICNSLGCAMVSPNFLKQLSLFIQREKKPILLWMYQ